MKVALVHDYLNHWGGAERVLQVLAEMFPDAHIYTLLHDSATVGRRFDGRVVKTSFLDFELARKNHRWFIPLMPLAADFLKLKGGYDLVISDTAGFAKGFPMPKNTKHISYCHSPLRYAWEPDYVSSKLKVKSYKFLQLGLNILLAYLRAWDKEASLKPHLTLANSHFIGGKIKQYYGLDASVLYPPVDTKFFSYDAKYKKGDYFLAVGRLMHYKKFDLVIDAFNKLKLPLKIAGHGPEDKFLMSLTAKFPVEFISNPSDIELRDLYRSARALIFPQIEDFGMVAAESLACGTPVVAFAGGGALEIVDDGHNGVLFHEQTANALVAAILKADKKRWSRKAISASAQKFSRENFEAGIQAAISRLMSS